MADTFINGGIQTVFPLARKQLIYLDFDGAVADYNGEILQIDDVAVSHSGIEAERIAEIVYALNQNYSALGVAFVSEIPKTGEYSTIFIGKTSCFDRYGKFYGVAETIDKGNLLNSDNAFVMLDSDANNAQIIDIISHETDHLLGILDHGGEGLLRYAHKEIAFGGTVHDKEKIVISSCGCQDDSICYDEAIGAIVESGGQLLLQTGIASNLTVKSGGFASAAPATLVSGAYVYAGGTLDIKPGAKVSGNVTALGRVCISSGAFLNVTKKYTLTGTLTASGGGIHTESASYKIGEKAIFSGSAGGDHDGLMNLGGSVYVGSSALFKNNNSSYIGGAIYNTGSMTIADKAKFLNNYAERGGAIGNSGWMKIGSSAVFSGNSNWYVAGGIAILNQGTMIIGDDASFENNVGTTGRVIDNMGTLEIGSNAKFIRNSKYGDFVGGGAVDNDGGSLKIGDNALFLSNFSEEGGTLKHYNGQTIVGNNAVFKNNSAASGAGTAITGFYGTMTFGNNTEISYNSTTNKDSSQWTNDGAGMYICDKCSVSFGSNTLFCKNSAYNGGAIAVSHSVISFGKNTIFSGNMAQQDGGAIDCYNGQIILQDARFATVTDSIQSTGGDSNLIINGNVSFAGNITVDKLTNNGNVDFNISVRKTTDGILLDEWDNVTGQGTYSVTVSASQKAGTYQLIDDLWDGFNKSITLKCGNSSLGKLTIGKTITTGAKQYSLVKNDDTIDLVVKDAKKPDLIISDMSFPATKISAYETAKLTFTVTNNGSASAKASTVYILDKNNKRIASLAVNALAAKKSQTLSYTFKAGALPLGSNKITVKADGANVVKEADEQNNSAAKTISIVKYDMQITKVTAASTISNKDALNITFTVKNAGNTASKASKVYIYDQNNKKLTGINIAALAQGASKNYTATVAAGKLPLGSSKLMLKADAGNVMKEVNESNNKVYKTVKVTAAADLKISALSVSTLSPTTADTVKFTIKVKNIGKTAAKASRLYLYEGSKKLAGVLTTAQAAGSTKTYTITLAPGKLAAGTHSVFVKADPLNEIKEANESNNSTGKRVLKVANSADLKITSLNVSDLTPAISERVKFTIKVKNIGKAAAKASRLYLYEGSKKLAGVLTTAQAAGSTKTYTITLAPGKLAAGTHNVFVKVDPLNEVKEANESNNSTAKRKLTVSQAAKSLTPLTPQWQVVAYEDVNFDGFADLLLANDTDLSNWQNRMPGRFLN